MLKKVLIVIGAIVVVFVTVVAMQPSEFKIERSAVMPASPTSLFGLVNDFREWKEWSPWANLDPAMKETYEGASSGEGSVYSWAGNDEVGEGRMTITESRPDEYIKISLEFLEPFPSSNTTEFTFTPQGDQSVVRWSMSGENNFMAKAFSLFVDMDQLVGADFEKGLAQMRIVAEASNATQDSL